MFFVCSVFKTVSTFHNACTVCNADTNVMFIMKCIPVVFALVIVMQYVLCSVCEMIVCLGETGIGKSTMMDTLFNTNFDSTPSSHDLPGVKLKAHTYGTVPQSALQCQLSVCAGSFPLVSCNHYVYSDDNWYYFCS